MLRFRKVCFIELEIRLVAGGVTTRWAVQGRQADLSLGPGVYSVSDMFQTLDLFGGCNLWPAVNDRVE